MDDNLIAAVGTVSMFNAVLFLKLRFVCLILQSWNLSVAQKTLGLLMCFLSLEFIFSSQISFWFSSFLVHASCHRLLRFTWTQTCFLLYRNGGVAACRLNILGSKSVCLPNIRTAVCTFYNHIINFAHILLVFFAQGEKSFHEHLKTGSCCLRAISTQPHPHLFKETRSPPGEAEKHRPQEKEGNGWRTRSAWPFSTRW